MATPHHPSSATSETLISTFVQLYNYPSTAIPTVDPLPTIDQKTITNKCICQAKRVTLQLPPHTTHRLLEDTPHIKTPSGDPIADSDSRGYALFLISPTYNRCHLAAHPIAQNSNFGAFEYPHTWEGIISTQQKKAIITGKNVLTL